MVGGSETPELPTEPDDVSPRALLCRPVRRLRASLAVVVVAAVSVVAAVVGSASDRPDELEVSAQPEVASVTAVNRSGTTEVAADPEPAWADDPVDAQAAPEGPDRVIGTGGAGRGADAVIPDVRPAGDPIAVIDELRDTAPRRSAAPVDPTVFYAYLAAASQWEGFGCNGRWSILAAIGHVESRHGLAAGPDASITDEGRILPEILGPVLDGSRFALIRDTDGGELDGDTEFDRAVGPMQFIPSTWARHRTDGNGDGVADPHNVYDATLSAARYLCSAQGGDYDDEATLAAAILSYNRSEDYVRLVLDLVDLYDTGQIGVRSTLGDALPLGVAPAEVFETDEEGRLIVDQLGQLVPIEEGAETEVASAVVDADVDAGVTSDSSALPPVDAPVASTSSVPAPPSRASEPTTTIDADSPAPTTTAIVVEAPAPAPTTTIAVEAPAPAPTTTIVVEAPAPAPTTTIAVEAPAPAPTTTIAVEAPAPAPTTTIAVEAPAPAPTTTIVVEPPASTTTLPVPEVIRATVLDVVSVETDDPTAPRDWLVIYIEYPVGIDLTFEWTVVSPADGTDAVTPVDDTATPGADEVQQGGTVVIASGRQGVGVPLEVPRDDLDEIDAGFLVEVRAVTPGVEFIDGKVTAGPPIVEDSVDAEGGDAVG